MPYGKLIDFEYVNKIDKKKLATIISIVALGLVVLCGLVIFRNKSEANKCPEKKFHMIPVAVDWSDALKACHLIKMKLISIESDEKQKQIVKEVKDAGLAGKDFWTCGSRANNGDTFLWKETGRNITYTNWAEGEPNKCAFDNPEECLNLLPNPGLEWNDVPCHFKHYVICEK